jgi:2'-5' RNA ligase
LPAAKLTAGIYARVPFENNSTRPSAFLQFKKTATVYWAIPAKPERDLFCSIVRILRKQFRAPNFEPHLTLFSTTKDYHSPKKALRQIRSRPVRLAVRGVAFSPKFTKTLFVRFKPSPALRKLVADVARANKSRAKAPRDPHVSLLYKRMSRTVKKEMAAVLRLPFRTAVFDSIAAVRLTLPVCTGADVEKWKIVAKKSLRRR